MTKVRLESFVFSAAFIALVHRVLGRDTAFIVTCTVSAFVVWLVLWWVIDALNEGAR